MDLYDWNGIEKEQLAPGIARQAVHTERMTVARIYLDQGAVVPEHHHENEQFTMLQKGRLLFIINGESQELTAGQSLRIPPNAVHRVESLADSMAIDLFSPRREDWISGDDAYLRG